MSGYQPEDRELFEREARGLYEQVLVEGALPADDPRLAGDDVVRRAFDLLVELGLLQLDGDGAAWRPIEPSNAQSRVVTPLGAEGARLIAESARWAEAFAALNQSWRRSPAASESGPFLYLHKDAINPYLTTLVSEASEELLTAQPQATRSARTVAQAAARDVAALQRGLSMRTLYQHSARRHPATHRYVAEVTEHGAEVRTLDEFFNRLIVVDRRVALIPAADDLSTAVVVREPAMVAYLVDVFERAFARARPFASGEQRVMKEIASEQRAMTIRMLIEGHADAVSAKRLGVSPRTYAGYVAELKEEYDAETRFQLGYIMGSRGIAGKDDDAR
ncbi:LuxR family transcriptional regulator [Nocardioides sp. zg-536]|uniref:LuxR family transcriptional regulator n=1 Tax=Nocardioides faecalis TaxID=2803858 RepID=A0A938Y717_9ACTN|nr:LuxR family transcriptional regulator [Nocardioides faecalis]MBM9458676.1 LuxR family transcriptional regulator [Nocardioides faecalis]MBS4753010.1 LuxR family transcriptional regulator [Nocardioides faecalis]QVI58669.1 LuxR family transcriptional regulator [Nocardioides faecalis]